LPIAAPPAVLALAIPPEFAKLISGDLSNSTQIPCCATKSCSLTPPTMIFLGANTSATLKELFFAGEPARTGK
jgi:hypothetical protein